MQALKLEQTKTTPEIHLSEGDLRMSGDAIPENPQEFYTPILHWIDKYKQSSFANNKSNTTSFSCDVNYFNTGSRGFILNILSKLNAMNNTGHKVKVEWKYAEEEGYQELAADFREMIEDFTLAIRFIPVKNFS